MKARFTSIFVILLLAISASARPFIEPIKQSHFLFDARGARAGSGDVAASYLFAFYLLEQPEFTGDVSIVADETAQEILTQMYGSADILDRKIYRGRLRVYTKDEWISSQQKPEIYVTLAKASGDFTYNDEKLAVDLKLPENVWKVGQVVLGNTELKTIYSKYGLIKYREQSWPIEAPGFHPLQTGRYVDLNAKKWETLSAAEVRSALLTQLSGVNPNSRSEILRNIVAGKVLKGAELGFVYRIENSGLSRMNVLRQFQSYLEAVISKSKQTGKAFVLVTPTAPSAETVGKIKTLYPQVEFIDSQTTPPVKPEPGKIYFLTAVRMSNSVFNGLLAYSKIPPLVAGDSAVSAMIELGKPFVATKVPWNEANIRNITASLQSLLGADEPARHLLESMYGPDESNLSPVFELRSSRFKKLFKQLINHFPLYPEVLINQLSSLKLLALRKQNWSDVFLATSDPVFRINILEGAVASRDFLQRPDMFAAVRPFLEDVLKLSQDGTQVAKAATIYTMLINSTEDATAVDFFSRLLKATPVQIKSTAADEIDSSLTNIENVRWWGLTQGLAAAESPQLKPAITDALQNNKNLGPLYKGLAKIGDPESFHFLLKQLVNYKTLQDTSEPAARALLFYRGHEMSTDHLIDTLIEKFLLQPIWGIDDKTFKQRFVEELWNFNPLTARQREAVAIYIKEGGPSLWSFLDKNPPRTADIHVCEQVFKKSVIPN